MKYSDLVDIVLETRRLFEKYEEKSVGKKWGNEELLVGLITDVGDLARIVLAKEGYRSINGDVEIALRHELADCLWAIIVLSEKYKIDLPAALVEMSKDIKKKIGKYDK